MFWDLSKDWDLIRVPSARSALRRKRHHREPAKAYLPEFRSRARSGISSCSAAGAPMSERGKPPGNVWKS